MPDLRSDLEAKKRESEYQKKYYAEHREEISNKKKIWYEANREKNNKAGRMYYALNKKKVRERLNKYRDQHPEVDRKATRKYHALHPDRVKESHERSRMKNGKEWYRRGKERDSVHPEYRRARQLAGYHIPLKEKCDMCGRKARVRHHPDYSEPLVVLHLCGKCHYAIHNPQREEKTA